MIRPVLSQRSAKTSHEMLLPHTDDCRTAFRLANKEAELSGAHHISAFHLLLGLSSAPGRAADSLLACGINSEVLRSRFDSVAQDDTTTKDIISTAISEAKRLNHIELDGGHLLLALIHNSDGALTQMLESSDVDVAKLRAEIETRLPQPSFPLDKAMVEFAEHTEVRKMKQAIDDEQSEIESSIKRGDFDNAAVHRDNKVQMSRDLQSLFEQLWNDAHG